MSISKRKTRGIQNKNKPAAVLRRKAKLSPPGGRASRKLTKKRVRLGETRLHEKQTLFPLHEARMILMPIRSKA